MNNIINVCFTEGAGGKFRISSKMNELNSKQKVIVLSDDLSHGPIKGGINAEERINWWRVANMEMNIFLSIEFKARSTGEIIPENIEKYTAAKRKLNLNEYRELLDKWELLKKDNSILRVIKDGKLESVDENYFDIDILKYTPKEFKTIAEKTGLSIEQVKSLEEN